MIDPFHAHWILAKHVLRYLHGTINLGLKYTAKNVRLHGYIDADWAGNFADRKSSSGCCFSLGFAMISWMSRRQKSVALSTTEAEYIAASMPSCEAVWPRKLFGELCEQVPDTTIIYCDNKSRICLAKIPCYMTSPSILRSSITIFGICCKEEQWCSITFPLMIR